jgi:alpha-mannosidase
MRPRISLHAVAILSVAAAGLQPAVAAPQPPPPVPKHDLSKGKNLYEVGYAHLDTQWRWTYLDTIGDYLPKTMHENFALFEQFPDYIFNFTGARRYRMMKEYYPADYAKLKKYVQEGRWYPNGSSMDEGDVNIPSPESIIRQTLYGNRYFMSEFGVAPTDYMIPDCFGFPASLPSILAHSGLKGFSTQKLTWGSAVGIPFTVGNWIGPDGRFITAGLDPGSYNSKINEDLSQDKELLARINKIGEQSGAYVDYRYFGTGDTGGSVGAPSVQWLEDGIHGTGPVTVISSRADQMFKDLTPGQISKLPTYKGDLELTQHSAGSLTSQAYMKRWNRKNELLADSAERASVAASWLGAAPYPQQKLNEAWGLILGSQMHDILPGSAEPQAYNFSWNDEVVALNRSAAALETGVGAISQGLDTRVKGLALVVYNPLSVERQDVVDATVSFGKTPPKYVQVYGPDGKPVPTQIAGRTGSTLRVLFLARVPSVGFAAFDLRGATAPDAANGLRVTKSTLENSRYTVRLNDNGDVAQVYDKVAKRNLLSAPARLAFKFDQPSQWPAWNMDWDQQSAPPTGYVTGPAKVRVVESGPVRVALEVTRESEGSKFVQTIRLSAGSAGDRVEFDNAIDWNTRQHNLKAVFPLAVSNKNATYNLGLGTIQRPTNVPVRYEVVHRQWFDLTDTSGKYGVAVLEDSKFGSDKPDDNTLRLTLLRTPGALSYQDQATQDIGHHQVLYALQGHQGDWRKGNTQWEAARLNQPLMVFRAPAHAGALGKSISFFSVNNKNVAIHALKKAEDTNEVIVRLQELSGSPAAVRFTAARPIVSAREVDGQEHTIGKATLQNGALVTNLRGYGPRAFALKLGNPPARLSAPTSKPLTLAYDTVAATVDGEASAKGFDGKGFSYSAALMPASLTSDGVPFRLAAGGNGRKSALSARGQKIALPGGKAQDVVILASAINGDQRGVFSVNGKSIGLTVQDWNAYVGHWDDRAWEKPAGYPTAQPLEGGIYGLAPAFIKRDPIAWVDYHRHKADGSNDLYAYGYLFQYRIPANGATSLTLPNNPNIRVFAATATTPGIAATQPAQYLYDHFTQPQSTPSASPAAASYSDTVEVSLQPSLYLTDAVLHYTTDGSTPTASSPVYKGPFLVTKNTTVRARGIHPNGTSDAERTFRYEVNDITPPSVKGVSAMAGSPIVVVHYSEPVNADAAGDAANYSLTGGLSVQSATPGQDGRSARLVVSPSLAAGTSYSLSITGVSDMSPAANTLASTEIAVTGAEPTFRLAPDEAGTPVVSGVEGTARVNGAPAVTNGPNGAALTFDGTADSVDVPNAPALNPTTALTITAWVKPATWDGGNRRILQKGRNDSQYRLTEDDGSLVFDLTGVGTVEAPLPSTGAWHFLAGTYDGATITLYVDGNAVASAPGAGQIAGTRDALHVGTKEPNAPASDHFQGDIGEVRIYDQALPAEYVQALMNGSRQSGGAS